MPSSRNGKATTNRDRRPTRTSAFGAGSRISHDSSEYYARALNSDDADLDVKPRPEQDAPDSSLDQIHGHTSENMSELPDRSVHLMVTSPPYNVGKEYDEDLSLAEYEDLLLSVLQETYRVLIDGGRACVNVANLGRKPYIPLHAIIIRLAEQAGFYMRGEIIWDKGAGAGTSTAWGSWMSASNPTLRDTHEYILVFQKPPFGRKRPEGRESTIERQEFLDFTKSVWTFPPQSAKRAKHPAPFPVELPRRLIQLYTFEGEVVLDPFMGSGATAIAAAVNNRRYVGYEISSEYLATAQERIDEAVAANQSQETREEAAT